MRTCAPSRRIALTAAVAAALATGATACGREGDLTGGRTQTSPPAQSEPATGTTPLKPRKTSKRPPAPTRTSPRTTTTPAKPTMTTTKPSAPTRTSPATATTPATPTTTPKAGPSAPAVSDWRLRTIGAAFARREFRVGTRTDQATLRRSRRNPRWVAVSGADGRTRWVVWLRDGVVAIAATDAARLNQGSVPCDVRPPFNARC